MNLTSTYSFFEEIKEATNMVLHFNDYIGLRSVVWPFPSNIISYMKIENHSIKEVERVWGKVGPKVEEIFKKYQLKDLGNVICFTHGISCEGWFDAGANSIHIRLVEYGSEKNLVDTMIHELLHLATYDKKLNYEEREAIVDNLLAKPDFRKIVH